MLRNAALSFILKNKKKTQEVALLLNKADQEQQESTMTGKSDICCHLSDFISRAGCFPDPLGNYIVTSNFF